MNYDFRPNKRTGRNQFVGSWKETGQREISLPFSSENLATVLCLGAGEQPSEHTHQDIAHWCDHFNFAYRTGNWNSDEQAVIRPFAKIAESVCMQWEMYLANTNSLEQLQSLNFLDVTLPTEWFQRWLTKVRELQSSASGSQQL
jgi:hypothetical protein